MTAQLAVTITTYAEIPADDYHARIAEVTDAIERALQQVDATYLEPQVRPGIPAEAGDHLTTAPRPASRR